MRPLGRRVVLGVTPLLLLLIAAEVGLRLAGSCPDDAGLSLSRGFDPTARYLVPDAEAEGGWRTRMFESGRPEVVVPPKGDVVRVVLLGGSNTQGFPEDLLQAELESLLPRPGGRQRWEVINLGRSGYGSERVAILGRQALVLQPDVIVVYSGHNEFVERGFARELEQHGVADALPISEWLGGLCLFSAMVEAFRPVAPGAGGRAAGPPALDAPGRGHDGPSGGGGEELEAGAWDDPEPWSLEFDAFRGLTYAETLRYLDAYRSNLTDLARHARQAGSGVVISTVIGNMLSPPWVATPSDGVSADAVAEADRLRAEALDAVPKRFRLGIRPALRLTGGSFGMALATDELLERRSHAPADYQPPRLRDLLGPLAETPETHGKRTPSVQGAHWTDPERWGEDARVLLATIEQVHAPALRQPERRRIEAARALLEAALVLDPERPDLLYDHGFACLLLGDGDTARHQLRAAGRFDRAPRRGTAASNERAREVVEALGGAAGGAILFDAEALFGARHPDGIVGYETMMDNCHLHPGARPVLMADLAPLVIEAFAARDR